MKVELHCHTRMSDGSLHFAELLGLAVQERIGHLAVTNHDTTQGLAGMDEMCRERGIEFIRLFLYGSSASYSKNVALAIACMTFVEIVMAVHGSIVMMRKGKAPAVSAIKLSNLAASLISLVLTQTAILSFTRQGDMS